MTRTRDEAARMTTRCLAVAALGRVVLQGEEPEVQAAAMAEMMAIFLHGHSHRDGDPAATAALREEILTDWLKVVRDLVAIKEAEKRGGG